jgi:outer membrane protein assembly factor BamB
MIAPTKNPPTVTLGFGELTVWRTRLPNVQFAVLPPGNTRSNPLAVGSRLFVSVFSPGAVCALQRHDGRLIWRRELPNLAGASVHVHNMSLFAQSSHTLYSLRPDSGEIVWSFCPYGTDGEYIYSSPSIHQGSIYIGDRRGFLHCLDVNSGEPIWRRRTNKARNDDVNSTPAIAKGLVIVATNANAVLAYEASTGKLAWRQKLDGPSVFGPLFFRRSVVVVGRQSLYLLNPETGEVEQHFAWKGNDIAFAESTPRNVMVALRGPSPPKGNSDVVLLNQSGIQRTAVLDAYCLFFRYAAETRLIYASHLHGVDLCHPDTVNRPWCK